MQRHQALLRISTARQAFTLVELLIVGAVIAILAALTLVAVNMVATTTKITKTRATIQKLDVAMQQIFETYEEEFAVIRKRVAADDKTKDLDKETRQKIAAHYIRDLMRMEMPQNWAEVQESPLTLTLGGETYPCADNNCKDCAPFREGSPLRVFYPTIEASSSELLFLIIQNLNPEALEAFHGSEVADTNGNGLLEFVDAWGKPIRFLRWAPGFSDSDFQQNVWKGTRNRTWEELLPEKIAATANHPDLLDERVNVVPDVVGWFLYPLIYSAGPDGDYGLDEGNPSFPPDEDGGFFNPFASPVGMPTGSSHFDNIHNHQWYR